MFYWPFNVTIKRVVILVSILVAIAILSLPAYNLAFAQDATMEIEYVENDTDPVAIFAADDPEGGMVFWSLAGDDEGVFSINGGVLAFKDPPVYGQDNNYIVIVRASDGGTEWTTRTVMVEVFNVDQIGTVAMSSLQPQAGIILEAELTDPDGGVTASDVDWTWARSDTSGGPFIDLDLPEERGVGPQQYEPKDNDVGKFLRATATYIDDEDPDEDKTASKVTVNPVRSASTDDTAPVFDAPDLTRNVPENTAAGGLVGLPVAATDASPNDVLTYSLEAGQGDAATDVDSFDINPATGQIKVAEGAMLNREETGGGSYSVVVEVTDASRKMAMVDVTINLTDVDEAPTVMLPTDVEAPAFNYTENAETSLGTFTRQDPEGFTTDWELSGPDADEFEISDAGALTFKDAPNFEDPKGGPNGDSNVYQVTVGATDGVNTGMLPVSIKVMDAEDDGEVTLSPSRPEIGMPVTATLMDDDGGFTEVTWSWQRGTSPGTTFTADTAQDAQDGIEDAEDAVYTPETADSGKYLRVSVTYTDAFGIDGSATLMEVTDNPVRVDSTNRPPMFLGMDAEVVTSYQRSVPEDVVDRNDPVNVGVVVTAENNTNGSYSLSGTDASTFRIDPGTGQITAPSETELNHETKATYTVIVTATNPAGASSRVTVTINVTDVDEMPEITGDDPEDYPEKSTVPVATFMGRDPEGSTVLWSLTETDADDDEFSITVGVLHFKNPPVFDSQESRQQLIPR